jgi:hypothetical protein
MIFLFQIGVSVMQAKLLPDGTISVEGKSGRRRFTHVHAGLAWPAGAPGALCVGGLRIDGRLHIFREYEGGLDELAKEGARIRRALPVDRFMIDGTDGLAATHFRTFPGICGEVVAAAVPRRILAHFSSALEKIKGMLEDETLLIHGENCPRLVQALRRPPESAIKAPLVEAMTWAVTGLTGVDDPENLLGRRAATWYFNVSRGAV